jgi:uncharacterized protein (TIGR02145 family)
MQCTLRFLLILVLLLPIFLPAQTVTGKLVDQNGNGLSGVQLQLYSIPKIYTATSSTDGSFTFTNITGVKDQQLPTGYSVSANYPNPFNPRTRIEITLPNNGNVKVELYNQIGQKVRSDIEKYFTAGNNYIDLELKGLSNGFYIARINVDGRYNVIRKLMLMYGSQHLISSTGSNTGVSKSNPLGSISLSASLDSLVATSTIIGRKTFLNLPNLTGNTLDLGNMIIERFCPGIPTVTYSGKTYNTIQIGTQCWLKENLDVGTMIDSFAIPSNNGIIEKYCYGNNQANCTTYGGLYHWNEAMQYVTTEGTKGICPTGWHIPTYAEFHTLQTTVSNDGNALKAVGQGTGNGAGTDTSGFSALLAGYRYSNGYFFSLGEGTIFWSSTEFDSTRAYDVNLYYNDSIFGFSFKTKDNGNSVRCAKD